MSHNPKIFQLFAHLKDSYLPVNALPSDNGENKTGRSKTKSQIKTVSHEDNISTDSFLFSPLNKEKLNST